MNPIDAKQKKVIWAAAREHAIDKQGVYDIIAAVSGKEHMSELTYQEASDVISKIKGQVYDANHKRTDTGGSEATVPLRRKIYSLTAELGWNNNNERINGFCKKMFGVERVEWLAVWQCHRLIEALKKMVERRTQ